MGQMPESVGSSRESLTAGLNAALTAALTAHGRLQPRTDLPMHAYNFHTSGWPEGGEGIAQIFRIHDLSEGTYGNIFGFRGLSKTAAKRGCSALTLKPRM